MSEAEILCDRVAFLHQGKIRAIGSPKQLKKEFGDETITVELTNGHYETIQNGKQDAQNYMIGCNRMQLHVIHKRANFRRYLCK
ncbi:hypothetical protein LSPH24S_09686 [Lysinibacillus sphaericus]